MVDVMNLVPGTRVKIIDHRDAGAGFADSGEMDHWLGAIMTVLEVRPSMSPFASAYATMEEDAGECSFHDNGHWDWFSEMIDYVVTDVPVFEIGSLDTILL